MKAETYVVSASWRSRPQDAAARAVSLAAMLKDLAVVHPAFAKWYWQGETIEEAQTPFCTMPPKVEELTSLLESQEDGGEMVHPWNGINGPLGISFGVMSGTVYSSRPFPNFVDIRLMTSSPDNADIQNAPILKAVLSAAVAAWKADWGTVEPWGFPEVLAAPSVKGYPPFRGGWITFLAAPFLPLIVPPRSAILEKGPDDGLLLIATEERFGVDNPSHVAVARDICAALAPLNTLSTLPGDTQPR